MAWCFWKIIRIISKVFFDAHTGVLFKEQEIFKILGHLFMYLLKRGLLPNYFRDMFTLASQIYSYNTRNSSLFYIPHCRTNFRKFSIRFQGPTFFNSLSREIENSKSISLFGKRLKKIPSFLVKLTLCWATHLFFFFFLFSPFFFFKKMNPNFHSVLLTCMVYSIVPGSLLFISPRLLYRLPCLYHI